MERRERGKLYKRMKQTISEVNSSNNHEIQPQTGYTFLTCCLSKMTKALAYAFDYGCEQVKAWVTASLQTLSVAIY